MTAVAVCPNPACATRYTVGDDLQGRRLRCQRCGQTFLPGAAAPLSVEGEPAAVGRYQVVGKLGAGAFGTVYRARDPHLDRDVAVKVLRRDLLASPRVRERFQFEAKAAARMLHPNIVPVFDAGPHADSFYLASAFIEGRTLAKLIPECGLEPRRAVALAAQLLDALAYAHGQGVLHRDVKPDNCLVDAQDRLFLTDFGLAGSLQPEEVRLTRPGAVLGTPAYLSPEQAEGDLKRVGAASDQYGAGVVLYELLCGRVPFRGELAAILYHAVHQPPPPPSQLRPGLDRTLEALCLQALAKRPEERFADCAAFAGVLRSWLAQQPAPSGPPAPTTPAARPSAPTESEVAWWGQETLPPLPPPVLPPARKVTPPPTTPPLPPPVPPRQPAPLFQQAPPPRRPIRQQSDTAREPEPPPRRRGRGRLVLALLGALVLLVGGVAVAGVVWWKWQSRPVVVQAAPAEPERPPAPPQPPTQPQPPPQPPPPEPPPPPPRLDPTVRADVEALAKLLLAGKGSTDYARDHAEERLPAWRRAADQGFPEGQFLLARCYAVGAGVDQDAAHAFRLLRKAADQGFPLAQNALALCYMNGEGITKDPAEGVRWYRKAADRGLAAAQYNLGDCYSQGRGVSKDPVEAFRWYRKAADRGHVLSQFQVGMCYRDGLGVDADGAAAVDWFRKAAEGGDAPAQFLLGMAYYDGKGVDRDYAEAVRWLQAAAEQGHAVAQCNLGVCYARGHGVPQDYATAATWYRKAVAQGEPRARSNLAYLHFDGLGVPKDRDESVRLWRLAASQGDPIAKRALEPNDVRIVGTWDVVSGFKDLPKGGSITLRFTAGGDLALTLKAEATNLEIEGTYKVNGDKVTLRIKDPTKPGTEPQEWVVTIRKLTDRELTLADEKETIELKRR